MKIIPVRIKSEYSNFPGHSPAKLCRRVWIYLLNYLSFLGGFLTVHKHFLLPKTLHAVREIYQF